MQPHHQQDHGIALCLFFGEADNWKLISRTVAKHRNHNDARGKINLILVNSMLTSASLKVSCDGESDLTTIIDALIRSVTRLTNLVDCRVLAVRESQRRCGAHAFRTLIGAPAVIMII